MNWEIVIPIVLQLVGTVVILAEIILPSMGMLSIVALSLFGYALYSVFTNVSATAGMTLLVADLIAIPIVLMIGIKLLARSPATLKARLSRKAGVTSQAKELADLEGKTGRVVSDLRPAGMVMIDGKRVDVVTRGEYVEKGTDVRVIAVGSNQVVVRARTAEQ